MIGKKKVQFCDAQFDCVDDLPIGMNVHAVVRLEDVELRKSEDGAITGEVVSCDFKGTFYDVAVQCGKNEVSVYTLKEYKEGDRVGIIIEPDSIHLIPYDKSINCYEATVEEITEDKRFVVAMPDFKLYVEPGRIYVKEQITDELINASIGMKLMVNFPPNKADLSDDKNAGIVEGDIVSFMYIGDHYSYTVRSGSETDYIVDDEYLWDQQDHVSVIIPDNEYTFKIISR